MTEMTDDNPAPQDLRFQQRADKSSAAGLPVPVYAAQENLVTLNPEQAKNLKVSLAENGDYRIKVARNAHFTVAGVHTLSTATGVLALFSAPPAAVMVFFLLALSTGGFLSEESRQQSRDGLSHDIDGLRQKVCEDFRSAHQEAFARKRHHLLKLADDKLAAGRCLKLEELAYLVPYDAAELGDASDQLAITVLQMRTLLPYYHNRRGERRADGSLAADRPLTFAALHLTPQIREHHYLLRCQLEKADKGRDLKGLVPACPEPDLSALNVAFNEAAENIDKILKIGKMGYILRSLAWPLFVRQDLNAVKKAQEVAANLSWDQTVPVPALEPVADLEAACSFYEDSHPPLDLPALRGWSGRRALPTMRSDTVPPI